MKIKPTEKQLKFMDWEFGIFFHFGIRSFFPGHADWDGKEMPAEKFNPTELDCKQWVRLAKKAGAKYCILTAKHHDGFANWPSKYSDYSVAQSPWEGGKGDVVDSYVKACREYGMKVGIYYSPAQWGGTVKFDEASQYDDYFINQVSELLTNYGKIDYIWFDGCGSENHEYDKPRIIKAIRELQPEILIFEMWDPDTRWIGNEDGYADMPNINVRNSLAFSVNASEAVLLEEAKYLPAECDMQMRSTWFDCEANEDTVRTLGELMGIYEYSVGRGANLLLNIGPDCRGRIPEPDAERLLEFGEEIRRRYGQPLDFGEITQNGNRFTITCDDRVLVDSVIIEEDITDGDAVQEFRILTERPEICVYIGKTVGHKAICRFPVFKTHKITVEVLSSDGEAKIKSVKAYFTEKK